VAYISPDRPVRAQNLVGETSGAAQVQAGLASTPKLSGKGVTIAIIDSGISASHPDFGKNKNKSRILTAVDFTGSAVSGDPYGHGTGVASVAAGSGDGSKGYADKYTGIAPEANLVALRVIFKYSGTSFAAPVVAGTIALMLEANKSLTPRLVKATLLRTAQSLPGVQYGNGVQGKVSQGAGQVNSAGAVEMARAIVPNADKLTAGDNIFRPNRALSNLDAISIGGESIAFNNRVAYFGRRLLTRPADSHQRHHHQQRHHPVGLKARMN
jgi:subtilisin family serine protease